MTNEKIIKILSEISNEYEAKAEHTNTNSLYKKYSARSIAVDIAIISIKQLEEIELKTEKNE